MSGEALLMGPLLVIFDLAVAIALRRTRPAQRARPPQWAAALTYTERGAVLGSVARSELASAQLSARLRRAGVAEADWTTLALAPLANTPLDKLGVEKPEDVAKLVQEKVGDLDLDSAKRTLDSSHHGSFEAIVGPIRTHAGRRQAAGGGGCGRGDFFCCLASSSTCINCKRRFRLLSLSSVS